MCSSATVVAGRRWRFELWSAVADLALALLRRDGTLAFFDDDRTLLNPGVKVGLPAGTYEIEVFDIGAGAAEPYTISCTVTPCLTDIDVAGLSTDAALGEHEADLFAVSLVGSQGITFATSADPASAASIGDTIVGLYDRNFRLILEIDDSCSRSRSAARTRTSRRTSSRKSAG